MRFWEGRARRRDLRARHLSASGEEGDELSMLSWRWRWRTRRSSDSQRGRTGYLQGRVLIARSPCRAPWDVQKVRAFGQAEVVDRFGGPSSGCLGVAPLRPESVFEPGSIFAVHNG